MRQLRSAAAHRPPPPARTAKQDVRGRVERFDQKYVEGSVTVPLDGPPVRIELCLNKITVTSTLAAVAAGPDPDDPGREIRQFRFGLRDIWRFARQADRLFVKADGHPLPIGPDARQFIHPAESGERTPMRLRQRLATGYVFDQRGRLRLSKKVDTEWQRQVMRLFNDIRKLANNRFGYDLFFIYGTLLGAVRENGFIGHDVDMDAAFICSATDGPGAVAELRKLAFELIDAGYSVEGHPSALHVTGTTGPRIDIFHLYFDETGRLCFPFGVAGTSTFTRDDWQGVQEIDFAGVTGVVPANAERLVERVYGSDWRYPKPGFRWDRDRTSRDPSGLVPLPVCEEIYWANFYAHTHYDKGSTFFDLVRGRADAPATVIDIGCGDGRDAFAFANAGRTVVGLDRSHVAVAYANRHAAELGLADRVRFRGVDVSDTAALEATIREVLDAGADAPVLFYLRFFLHSIPKDVQDGLLGVIDGLARPGDMFAAEFRTEQDEALTHVHRKHYRRFQNGPAFGAELNTRYGFELLHEHEGTGLSPYRDEDPVLYRVIGRRR